MSRSITGKTDQTYWDEQWKNGGCEDNVDPSIASFRNSVKYKINQFISMHFLNNAERKDTLIELGCARSVWLPYFSSKYGLRVVGLDSSKIGCEIARQMLKSKSVEADVYCANLFAPPEQLIYSNDYVVSFGVVEHFEDTDAVIRACAEFLKEGGIICTIIPNMNGVPGWLQRILNRKVYDIHVPLDSSDLASAHRNAELTVLRSEYLMFMSLGVLVLKDSFFQIFLRKAFATLSLVFWYLEKIGIYLPPNIMTSPFVVCIAKKEKK
jgi:2-polyprenyl-3-methyl-5-hydroxy-6-metoxy-1,4-benzoquinol methylase